MPVYRVFAGPGRQLRSQEGDPKRNNQVRPPICPKKCGRGHCDGTERRATAKRSNPQKDADERLLPPGRERRIDRFVKTKRFVRLKNLVRQSRKKRHNIERGKDQERQRKPCERSKTKPLP